MNVPARYDQFWKDFVATCATDPAPHFLEAFHFDDNEPTANALAALVLAGTKRATAGLLWVNEQEARPLAKAGDFSIITDFSGEPVCVIQTTHVEIVPFEDVTEEFAAIEGEGDGSLRYWREEHEKYFGRECKRLGREPHPRMPVICEQFKVVYSGATR